MLEAPEQRTNHGQQRLRRLHPPGTEFKVHVCVDCGYIEGERPQSSCCPLCGSGSGNVATAVAVLKEYFPGDYWPRPRP